MIFLFGIGFLFVIVRCNSFRMVNIGFREFLGGVKLKILSFINLRNVLLIVILKVYRDDIRSCSKNGV